MLNIKVAVPGLHMAGSDAHHNAHIEVGHHGFALFLSPEAEYPVLDVNGTSEQLELLVRGLQAALVSRGATTGVSSQPAPPLRVVARTEPSTAR